MEVDKGYYKRRNVEDRFRFLEQDWFEGKACMDIGCNEGLVTATIAERFHPRMIIGIDRDRFLIDSAHSLLKRAKYKLQKDQPNSVANTISRSTNILFKPRALSSKGNTSTTTAKITQITTSSGSSNSNTTCSQSQIIAVQGKCDSGEVDSCSVVSISDKEIDISAERSKLFPFNLDFVHKDIFELAVSSGERYDTILCLSVTKWIHLYHGDQGLLQFFHLVHRLLRKGGIFILEYQQWNSYKKRKNTSDQTEKNFSEINILPDAFEDVLTTQLNFQVLRKYVVDVNSSVGFNRPIIILTKLS